MSRPAPLLRTPLLRTPPLFLATSILTSILAAGCSLEPQSVDEACPAPRRAASGECCPVWTAAEGASCAARPFSLPTGEDGLGDGGARWINVAVDGLGRPSATWVVGDVEQSRMVVAETLPDSDAPGGGLFALRDPSAVFEGTPVQGDIAAGPSGEIVVAWKQQLPAEQARVFVSEREPDGTWTEPTEEDDSFSFLPTAYEPHPRVFDDGERLVVWNQWMSTGYGVAVADKPPSGEWQFPDGADDVLSQHYLFSNAPNPAINSRGDAIISWYQSGGASLLAWMSERWGHDGQFSRPGPDDYLSSPDAPIDSHPFANPKPALAEDGTGAVVWTQENGKGSTLVYLATRTSEGAWTRPDGLDDALSPRLGYARCPQIAFAPTGDLFIVWYQDTGNGDRVYAAHRSPDGAWIEPGREPTKLSTPGRQATFPTLAVGRGGAVLAAWSEREGDHWIIAARRRAPEGTEWGPIEVLSPPIGGVAAQPAAAIGGEGDFAVVGWTQGDGKGDKAFFATVPVGGVTAP